MRVIRKDEVRLWCQDRSVGISSDDYLYFEVASSRCLAIDLPEKPFQLIALANTLIPFTTSVPFKGAMLWIRQWGKWDETVERVGYRVFELVRHIHGQAQSLDEAPGFLFGEQDLIDLQVCLIQPLMIGWDAFLVPESADYIVATSHDETTFVIARSSDTYKKLFIDLESWNPREDHGAYFRGTSIPV